PDLDSLFFLARAHVRLYILFTRPFMHSVLSALFDPSAPYADFSVYMTHPPVIEPPPQSPPHFPPGFGPFPLQAHAPVAPASDSDPSEDDSSSSSSDSAVAPMANGFL